METNQYSPKTLSEVNYDRLGLTAESPTLGQVHLVEDSNRSTEFDYCYRNEWITVIKTNTGCLLSYYNDFREHGCYPTLAEAQAKRISILEEERRGYQSMCNALTKRINKVKAEIGPVEDETRLYPFPSISSMITVLLQISEGLSEEVLLDGNSVKHLAIEALYPNGNFDLLEAARDAIPVVDDAMADANKQASDRRAKGDEERAERWEVVAKSFQLQLDFLRSTVESYEEMVGKFYARS